MRRDGAGGGDPGGGGVAGVKTGVPSCSTSASPSLSQKSLSAFFPYGFAAAAAGVAGDAADVGAAAAVAGAGVVAAGVDVVCATKVRLSNPKAARPRAQRLELVFQAQVSVCLVLIPLCVGVSV
jgi:hypothetical protein